MSPQEILAQFGPREAMEYDVVVVGAGGAGLRATLGMAEQGLRTADIMQPGKTRVTTSEMGAAVMRELERLAA